jgi:hypothetical protein
MKKLTFLLLVSSVALSGNAFASSRDGRSAYAFAKLAQASRSDPYSEASRDSRRNDREREHGYARGHDRDHDYGRGHGRDHDYGRGRDHHPEHDHGNGNGPPCDKDGAAAWHSRNCPASP